MLAHGSERFRKLIDGAQVKYNNADDLREIPVIRLDDEDFEVIQEIIEFIYTGTCSLLKPFNSENCVESDENEIRQPFTDDEMVKELAWSLEIVDFDILDNLQIPFSSEFYSLNDEKDTMDPQVDESLSTSKQNSSEKVTDGFPVDLTYRKELLHVAKKFRISELVSRLALYTFCLSLPQNILSLTPTSNSLTQKYIHFIRPTFTSVYTQPCASKGIL